MGLQRSRRGAQSTRSGNEEDRGDPRVGLYNTFFAPRHKDELQQRLRGPKDVLGEPIIFIRGAYLDYIEADRRGEEPTEEGDYHRWIHRIPRSRSGNRPRRAAWMDLQDETCSAGHVEADPQPCVYCVSNDQNINKRSQQWCWNIIHLALYHAVPKKQFGDGPPKNGKEQEFTYQICHTHQRASQLANKQCRHCSSNPVPPLTFGAHRWMGLNWFLQDGPIQWNAEASRKCRYCNTFLEQVGYDCRHCYQPMVEARGDDLTNEEIEHYERTKRKCKECGKRDILLPAFECGFDEDGQKVKGTGCTDEEIRPTPLSLFDYVWWVQRSGDSNKVSLTYARKRRIEKTKITILAGTSNEQIIRPNEKLITTLCPRPYDFETMLRPDSTAVQARKLGLHRDPYDEMSTPSAGPRFIGGGGGGGAGPLLGPIPGQD